MRGSPNEGSPAFDIVRTWYGPQADVTLRARYGGLGSVADPCEAHDDVSVASSAKARSLGLESGVRRPVGCRPAMREQRPKGSGRDKDRERESLRRAHAVRWVQARVRRTSLGDKRLRLLRAAQRRFRPSGVRSTRGACRGTTWSVASWPTQCAEVETPRGGLDARLRLPASPALSGRPCVTAPTDDVRGPRGAAG